VLDIGRGGARLWGLPWPPQPGDALQIRLAYVEELAGRVAWARGREAGVTYAGSSLPAAEAAFRVVEAAWDTARLALHDPACDCESGGRVLEPPFPEGARAGRVPFP
jgi:hypothetical protein